MSMMTMPQETQGMAYFRCEASSDRGAGHAVRCGVLADALTEKGWKCCFVTSHDSYAFISALSRFERVDPDVFYENPLHINLLVVDNYDLDVSYEAHFRPYANKILVIDDLANRSHDCDILLDQTYSRSPDDYRTFVPRDAIILAGSEYVLIRPEFVNLRSQALEKRKNTKEIKKLVVSMGGSDFNNFTLKALKLIKASEFMGTIDVVLGFSAPHFEEVKAFADTMKHKIVLHIDANMAQLIFDADLAIGAGGTSVWERCCLGLPALLMKTAENQSYSLSKINHLNKVIDSQYTGKEFSVYLRELESDYQNSFNKVAELVDGKGLEKLTYYLSGVKQ